MNIISSVTNVLLLYLSGVSVEYCGPMVHYKVQNCSSVCSILSRSVHEAEYLPYSFALLFKICLSSSESWLGYSWNIDPQLTHELHPYSWASMIFVLALMTTETASVTQEPSFGFGSSGSFWNIVFLSFTQCSFSVQRIVWVSWWLFCQMTLSWRGMMNSVVLCDYSETHNSTLPGSDTWSIKAVPFNCC